MWRLFTKVARRAPAPTLLRSSLPLLLHHPSSSYSYANQSKTQYSQHHFPPPDGIHFKINEPSLHIEGVVRFLRKAKGMSEFTEFLVSSDIHLTEDLVVSVIWELRHDWELALLLFKWWRHKCKCKCEHSSSTTWNVIVWVLAHHAKFTTAWTLIRHMLSSSMDARPPILVMIQSYAVANFPRKAIQTFQAMEKLRIGQDSEALHTLLHALCTNGNIEEAEEFMHLNKCVFPLQTKSFNIILNGWCNLCVDLIEAKRVWREMCSSCITPDATSYTHMISCFSKAAGGNLFECIRLYDEMKKRGWVPGLEVYNSLIYALSRENCMKEASNLVDKIKEAGLQPDSTTYNSMILPLCEAHNLEEANRALINMTRMGLQPTAETYHAFIKAQGADESLEVLKTMKKEGCGPYGYTFCLLIDKLLKSKQPEFALRVWLIMMNYGVEPDCAHYSIMVQGLASCGWFAKANKFYNDMKLRGIPDDPKLQHMLNKDPSTWKSPGKTRLAVRPETKPRNTVYDLHRFHC